MVAEKRKETLTPEKLDKNAAINPSSNLYARNPTRMEISHAENQRDIVDQIKAAGAGHKKIRYLYVRDEEGNWEYSGLPGVLYVKEMTDEQLEEFFRTLLRSKPNIIGLNLSLGEYKNKAPYTGTKLSALNFNRPRHPTDVAADMASLFGDPALRIVEFSWQINSAAAGSFRTEAKAYSVPQEDYDDKEQFSPCLTIEYFQHS